MRCRLHPNLEMPSSIRSTSVKVLSTKPFTASRLKTLATSPGRQGKVEAHAHTSFTLHVASALLQGIWRSLQGGELCAREFDFFAPAYTRAAIGWMCGRSFLSGDKLKASLANSLLFLVPFSPSVVAFSVSRVPFSHSVFLSSMAPSSSPTPSSLKVWLSHTEAPNVISVQAESFGFQDTQRLATKALERHDLAPTDVSGGSLSLVIPWLWCWSVSESSTHSFAPSREARLKLSPHGSAASQEVTATHDVSTTGRAVQSATCGTATS
mmetsp:Transcript_42659/g.112568  ORF Transcript_42659/g.112568 Transcript_42659/m.112568 type:complete len:267 (+) Transcript_42659:151-951(+)